MNQEIGVQEQYVYETASPWRNRTQSHIRHCSLAVRMVLRWPLSRTSADAARGQQRRRGARNNRLASVRCSKRRAKAYLGAICRDSFFLPKTLPGLDPLDLFLKDKL